MYTVSELVFNVFQNGATPLIMACQIGSLETVKELLRANADVNLTDPVVRYIIA